MEYIHSKKFLKENDMIQKALINWWKPEIGDLFADKNAYGDKDIIFSILDYRKIECIESDKDYGYYIPLLTEGQLRKFIEDKIQCKVEVIYVDKEGVVGEKSYYRIERCSYLDRDINNSVFETETDNLIEAYWEVACRIASYSCYPIKKVFTETKNCG